MRGEIARYFATSIIVIVHLAISGVLARLLGLDPTTYIATLALFLVVELSVKECD